MKGILKKLKLTIRSCGLKVADFFATEIVDCLSGERLGRGLLLSWSGKIFLIGYQGKHLVPKFLPQKRLTYWKQEIGFTAQAAPDFPSLKEGAESESAVMPKVMNLLITHEGGEKFDKLMEWWKPICQKENLWIAFGGTRENFEKLHYPRKVFIDDPKLRTCDHQREKQSYAGIFRAMVEVVEKEKPDYIYFCEYDQLPLVSDLNGRQIRAVEDEGADVMGHMLDRVDHTGYAHLLFHESDPVFFPFLKSISCRHDPSVVLTMFGSGSFWRREAFLAVAKQPQPMECYLELYLPTLVHHLGFRVRRWDEDRHLISNLPSPKITIEAARKCDAWTVHPVKEISGKKLTSDE
jgi:hypothetical protein